MMMSKLTDLTGSLLAALVLVCMVSGEAPAQHPAALKPLSQIQPSGQRVVPPRLEGGVPAYTLIGGDTLLHPNLLFDPELARRFAKPSQASQAAEKKAQTAKIDLSGAIAILQQNGTLNGSNQRVVAALRESENTIGELETLTQEIEAERVARSVEAGEQSVIASQYFAKLKEVEQRSLELAKEADDLENRERFFSTGFYASLAAIGMGIIGVCLQLPTVLLDRQLKKLELIKRRNELEIDSTVKLASTSIEPGPEPGIKATSQPARPAKRQAA